MPVVRILAGAVLAEVSGLLLVLGHVEARSLHADRHCLLKSRRLVNQVQIAVSRAYPVPLKRGLLCHRSQGSTVLL